VWTNRKQIVTYLEAGWYVSMQLSQCSCIPHIMNANILVFFVSHQYALD